MTQSNLEIYQVEKQNLQYKYINDSIIQHQYGKIEGTSENTTRHQSPLQKRSIYKILLSNIFILNANHVCSIPSILNAFLFTQILIIFHLVSFYYLLMVLIYTVARMNYIKCKPDHTIFSPT